MSMDIQVGLEVAEKIDDRINLLDGVIDLTNEMYEGGTDVTLPGADENDRTVTAPTMGGEEITFTADQAGQYIHLDGMPGDNNGVFDMGSVQGSLAVGLYQQMTDTISQGLTSTIDQAKRVDTKMQRTMSS